MKIGFYETGEKFEADNEIDNSSKSNKTSNIYKQNPVLNGHYIESEKQDVLKIGHHKSPLGYNNIDWFVIESKKLENEMVFYFKNTMKYIIMPEGDKKDYRNNNICRFCEKNFESDKVRDHSHSRGIYRGPAHSKCNINVTQTENSFNPILFHNFSNYDCDMFFKRLVDLKNDRVKFGVIPKTNEEYISVTNGCFRFNVGYRFLSSNLDSLVKTLVDSIKKN